MRSVAILGTGPAGLMAAHAASVLGIPFSLFGLPDSSHHVVKSTIGGAQFLHRAVPGIVYEDDPDMIITYRKRGTSEGYRQKVYGTNDVPFVSFDNVSDGFSSPAWSLHRAYDRLWDGICGPRGHSVNALTITPETIEEWLEKDLWDLILCTIPRPAMCRTYNGSSDARAHAFHYQEIRVCGEDMGAGLNEIIYNGDPEQSWYRSSNMGGIVSTEWGTIAPPPYFKTFPIKKPIGHDCRCWDGKPIVFAGRYGEWRKGILVHEAFVTAFKALQELRS